MNMGFPPFMSFMSEFFFISLLVSYSYWVSLFFLFSLILVGKVFILTCLNFLFGKSNKSLSGSLDLSFLSYSFLYSFMFSFFFILSI